MLHYTITGPYKYITYSDLSKHAEYISNAMIELGIQPRDRIGIYSINRPEWCMVEYACYRINVIPVPLYDTLGMYSMVLHSLLYECT